MFGTPGSRSRPKKPIGFTGSNNLGRSNLGWLVDRNGSLQSGSSGTLTIGPSSIAQQRKVIVHVSSAANSANQALIWGYQAAFEVINNGLTQNWYFGVDDNDGNKLKIGKGYSAGNGIAPNISVDPTNTTWVGNSSDPGAAFGIATNAGWGGGDSIFTLVHQGGDPSNESLIRHKHYSNFAVTGAIPHPIFTGIANRGTITTGVTVATSDCLLILDGRGYDTTGDSDTSAQLAFLGTQTWSSGAHGSRIRIETTPNNSITPIVAGYVEQDGNTQLNVSVSVGSTVSPGSGKILALNTVQAGVSSSTTGSFLLTGATSGTVTIQPQASAGVFNFNLPITAGSAGQVLGSGGGGTSPMTWRTLTVSVLTSNTSATFTTPSGVAWLRVRMVGGGGGAAGNGSSATNGGAGGNTTFTSTSGLTLTSCGGGGGQTSAIPGNGGNATGGDLNLTGATGNGAGLLPIAGVAGGGSPFGGAGGGGFSGGTGGSAQPNTGSGGGSGAGNVTATLTVTGAGGAGGYLEKIITSPSSVYTYSVGVAGTAGGAGTGGVAGGAGGSGLIIIESL